MRLPFELPPPRGSSLAPTWDGRSFACGETRTAVLEYSENLEGWSDALTDLHEEAVGDSHPIDIASRNDALAQVRNLRPAAGAVILEIGCSSGFLLRELVSSFPEAVVLGADVVKKPLQRLAKTLPGVPLMRFDLLQCPLPEGSIDVLLMLNVLEHIEDDASALRKAFALLKPGGALILEVPAGPALYDAYDAELRHFRRYASSELEEKLTGAGFRIARRSHLGFLLFPAFALTKWLGRRGSPGQSTSVVGARAGRTAGSTLVRWALELEARYVSGIRLPFGIRVLAVGIKGEPPAPAKGRACEHS